MSFNLANYLAVTADDLTTPTAVQGPYPMGYIAYFLDTDYPNSVKAFMYVKAHAALTQYQPYVVHGSASSGAAVYETAAPATIAGQETVCVPQVAFTSGYYGFVQIQGRASALLINETHVAGDYLELLTTGTAFVVDGSTGSTVYSVKSVAQLLVTAVGAVAGVVQLLGGYRTSLVSAS